MNFGGRVFIILDEHSFICSLFTYPLMVLTGVVIMEYSEFFAGLFGIILGGVITYYGQILHSKYLSKQQNKLDLKYLLLELEKTKISIESIEKQLEAEGESNLVEDQIKYHLDREIYKNRYQFFLMLSDDEQREYYTQLVLLVHGLESLEFNLISCLSIENDAEKRKCHLECVKMCKTQLMEAVIKFYAILLSVEEKL